MSEALNIIYEIYSAFIGMLFTTFDIGGGVTIGWVFIAVIVFGMLINSILNLPRSMSVMSVDHVRSNYQRSKAWLKL